MIQGLATRGMKNAAETTYVARELLDAVGDPSQPDEVRRAAVDQLQSLAQRRPKIAGQAADELSQVKDLGAIGINGAPIDKLRAVQKHYEGIRDMANAGRQQWPYATDSSANDLLKHYED